ncbi:uncharacterized protein LOC135375340 isoform X2 [Ornithodoros turicata]|uniref:uncharacterized protein LOC135375340 isoform X2 n=1 Tax=Ornithodoros turicata TaxID=34597 RepID=UPI00313936A3
MYAHVKYLDNAEAILPVTMIKNFHPRDVNDVVSSPKEVFWTDGQVRGYYKGRITLLRETKAEMITALNRMRKAIPVIFDESLFDDPPTQASQELSTREKRANARTAHNKELRQILDGNSSKEETVPKHLLDEAREEAVQLKVELQVLRGELREERDMCKRLQETLLEKIDTVFKAQQQCSCTMTSSVSNTEVHPGTFTNLQSALRCVSENLMTEPPQAFNEEPYFSTAQPTKQLGSTAAVELVQEQVPVQEPCTKETTWESTIRTEDTAMCASSGQQADLGDGVYIPQDKLDMAMLSSTDSIFVREIARSLWAPEELQGRSVTGKPCQRYLKQGIKAKRALTPRKVGALKRCFQRYASQNNCRKGRSLTERLDLVNSHLADFLKRM